MDRREFLAATVAAAAAGGVGRGALASEPQRRTMVSVISCPRPGGVSYLEGTLAAVDAAIPDATKVLFWDGDGNGMPATSGGWTRVHAKDLRDRRVGVVDNKTIGFVPIWLAAQQRFDLLFLEDDVLPVDAGALARMFSHRVPDDVAFTSFFHRQRPPGRYDAWTFDMSQAVKIPLRTLRELALFGAAKSFDWEAVVGVDLAIAAAGKAPRWRYELAPAHIRHVGLVSAVSGPVVRQAVDPEV